MQKEKEKISIQKRIMGNNLAERKKLLMDKVSNILTTGHFKTKEDIYRKVFNEDELQTLGYSLNKTISSNNSRIMMKKKIIKMKTDFSLLKEIIMKPILLEFPRLIIMRMMKKKIRAMKIIIKMKSKKIII